MFHMSNDSHLFRTREELEDKEGAYSLGGNRFNSPSGEWVPLYEGKMVQAYDHRAANIVVVNPQNRHRPAQPVTVGRWSNMGMRIGCPIRSFGWLALRFRLKMANGGLVGKDVTAPTNVRTVIASIIPQSGVGNTFPVLLPLENPDAYAMAASLLLANLNAISFDYVARQKVQGQHLNWYILEQLPVVPARPLRVHLLRP